MNFGTRFNSGKPEW